MENYQPIPSAIRPAAQIHRRQVFWQILLPILGTIFAVLAGLILVIVSAGTPQSNAADWSIITTIFLILPWLFLGLIPLAFLFLCIWLLKKTRHFIAPYLVTAGRYSRVLKIHNAKFTQAITAPFIQVRSVNAGITRLLRLALHIKSSPKE